MGARSSRRPAAFRLRASTNAHGGVVDHDPGVGDRFVGSIGVLNRADLGSAIGQIRETRSPYSIVEIFQRAVDGDCGVGVRSSNSATNL